MNPVAVVLDTNVVMSAIYFGGIPRNILSAWDTGRIRFIVSPEILAEYHEIAERLQTRYPTINSLKWLSYIESHAEIVAAPPLSAQVCEDADDDAFIACAVASSAKVICSGDKLLLATSGYQGIEVLSPRDFYNKYL